MTRRSGATTLLLAAAAALAIGPLAACGGDDNAALPGSPDASHDSPVTPADGGGDAKPASDGGVAGGEGGVGGDGGEGGAGCGSDKSGTARAPFTCCVMGLVDGHTTSTDLPDPAFCNNLADDPADPAQFDKYFP
jgi:hypothetical protein